MIYDPKAVRQKSPEIVVEKVIYVSGRRDKPLAAVTDEGKILVPAADLHKPAGLLAMLMFSMEDREVWDVEGRPFVLLDDLEELYPHLAEKAALIREKVQETTARKEDE